MRPPLGVARHVQGAFGLTRLSRQTIFPTTWRTLPFCVPRGNRRLQSQDATKSKGDGEKAKHKTELRPYQTEAIRSVLDYIAKGERRLGISLATGSGKTVIFSHLIGRILPPTPEANQSLVLGHRQELIQQAANHCRNLYGDENVEIEMGKSVASGLAGITVASVQSLISRDRLSKYDPARFKLILVDEAHHIAARSYAEILRHFGLVDNAQDQHIALVGVSATFSREDGLSLGKYIDHIVYHKDYLDMIEDEWLSSMTFTTVESGADLSKVKTARGDFQTGSLSQAVNYDEANVLVVRSWLAKAQGRKSTLVFCVDLSHVANLTAMFRQHGIDAHYITGDTSNKVRQERLDSFRKGEYPVLLNCGIFTEGTDIPNIDCIILARPTKSRNLLLQMIGRGLRKHAGKENCHVIDMVASLQTGIVTTPTLFGLDPDAMVENAGSNEMKRTKDRKEEERMRDEAADRSVSIGPAMPALSGNITFTDYDDVNDLLENTSGERHIRAMSPHAWVQVDDSRIVLFCNTGDFITLRQAKDAFEAIFTGKIPAAKKGSSPFMRPRQICKARTLQEALRAADTFAKTKMPFQLISKTATWRQAPASDTQVVLLNKMRSKEKQLEPGAVTKGRAGDLITKLRHGAKGWFERTQSAKRQVQKVEAKKQDFVARQERAQVRVGPLGKSRAAVQSETPRKAERPVISGISEKPKKSKSEGMGLQQFFKELRKQNADD
jgi:ATP-dependent helicase IRC3